jgi:hypothetical protein
LIVNRNQQSGRALFVKTDLQDGATDRSERLPAKLRRRLAPSRSLLPYDAGGDACDDAGDDESWAMLRH